MTDVKWLPVPDIFQFMNPRHLLIALFLAGTFPATKVRAQTVLSTQPALARDETPEQRETRMQWWRQARFGMFIHWGVYSVPAGTYQGKRIPSSANGS